MIFTSGEPLWKRRRLYGTLSPGKAVFKVGQWAYSPAGVPTSIMTGRLAVKKALGV